MQRDDTKEKFRFIKSFILSLNEDELEYAIAQIDIRLSGKVSKEETSEWRNDFKHFILVKTEKPDALKSNVEDLNTSKQISSDGVHLFLGESEKERVGEPLVVKVKEENGLPTFKNTSLKDRPYKCNICQKTYGDKCQLKYHEKIHTDETRYHCNECVRSFKNRATFEKHKLKHTSSATLACDICNKTFSTKQTLQNHKTTIHQNMKSHACSYCNKLFSQKSNRDVHEKLHKGEKDFSCRFCGKEFVQKVNVLNHERKCQNGNHSNSNVITNNQDDMKCDRTFIKTQEAHGDGNIKPGNDDDVKKSRHVASDGWIVNDKKRNKCQNCEKSFVRKECLKKHEESCTGSDSISNLSYYSACQNMPEFEEIDNIIKSKVVDIGNGEYHCTDCGYVAKSFHRAHMYNHVESRHVKHKGVTCQLCGHICPTRQAHRVHLATGHGIKPKLTKTH